MKPLALLSLALIGAAAVAQVQEPIKVEFRGDTVLILNTAIAENCAALFEMEVERRDFSIVVLQRDTVREKMRCICDFDLEVALNGLSGGDYSLELRREYRTKYGYPGDTIRSIGKVSFTVSNGGEPGGFYARQSGCRNIMNAAAPHDPGPPEMIVTPNPLSRSGGILNFESAAAESGELMLYDAMGRRIARLLSGEIAPGSHGIKLDPALFPSSGQYHLVLKTRRYIAASTFAVIK